MSVLEQMWDSALGKLHVLKVGWPDRLIEHPTLGWVAVEIKQTNEPLRPSQWEMLWALTSVGVNCFVGTLDPKRKRDKEDWLDHHTLRLVPFNQWQRALSERGRPTSGQVISVNTSRRYRYLLLNTINEIEAARQTPDFPSAQLAKLDRRREALAKRLEEFDNALQSDNSQEVQARVAKILANAPPDRLDEVLDMIEKELKPKEEDKPV